MDNIMSELELKKTKNELKRYKKAYDIFMNIFDSLYDDDKEYVDKELRKIDL